MKEHYDENSEKMKKQMKEHYDENSEKMKKQMKEHNEKVNLKSKHKSGFESVCISCCRLGNNSHPIKNQEEIEVKFPKADRNLFFFMEDFKVNNQYRLCETCYRAFKEGRTPRLNMKTTKDYLNIGEIPYDLPKLNNLEAYIIKLRIPFLRLANMPRSPNLKVFGNMVMVSADVNESVQKIEGRLELQNNSLIPVNFKRKLSYRGSYMSKMIDAKKVFSWLDYLKKHNPLYADIQIDREALSNEIKQYERQLLKEAALFDDNNNADSAEENDSDPSDNSSDEDEVDTNEEVINIKEYFKEDAAEPQDTLMVDVREANIHENSVTNQLAQTIIEKETGIFFSEEEENMKMEKISSEEECFEEKIKGDKQQQQELSGKKIKSRPQKKKKIFSKKGKNKKEEILNVAPGEKGKMEKSTVYTEVGLMTL